VINSQALPFHGFTLERHGSVGSTNDIAMTYLRQGGADRNLFIAEKQEQGRGRLGRVWVSKPGNLYASLALRDPCDIAKGFQLGFVAALVIRQALSSVGAQSLSLKWPNDVLMRGAKISGILIEGSKLPDSTFACVIGTGINLADHPTDTPYPATDLASQGLAITVDAFLPQYLAAWDEMLMRFERGRGFNTIRAEWLSHAKGLGEPVTVRGQTVTREGIFTGLDEDGRLLLNENGHVSPVVAGDVSFLT
jgi:BirA family biotin operon repressor/biotin-[acetyl-CoA-carboxylase] ligase